MYIYLFIERERHTETYIYIYIVIHTGVVLFGAVDSWCEHA